MADQVGGKHLHPPPLDFQTGVSSFLSSMHIYGETPALNLRETIIIQHIGRYQVYVLF